MLHTNVAPNDPALLPLLRQHGVQISVKSQQQPFAVQLLLTLLPWALIIGVWSGCRERPRACSRRAARSAAS